MPPPGYEPFLRAICANPEDDTVRLVYADWLAENGDEERAEFIRCQIACGANPHPKNPAFRRAEQLRKANNGKWKAELPKPNGVDWGAFTRGFVSAATFKGSWLIHDALASVVQVTPLQEIVLAHCDPNAIHELVRSPYLGQVRRLESRAGYASDKSLQALADCPQARALEVLTLPGEFWTFVSGGRGRVPVITDQGAIALAKSPHLTRLRQLRLGAVHITAVGTAILHERFGDGFTCGEVFPTQLPDRPPE